MFSWYHFLSIFLSYLFPGKLALTSANPFSVGLYRERKAARRRAYFKRLDEHPKKDRVEALLTAARAPESHVVVADARVGVDIH